MGPTDSALEPEAGQTEEAQSGLRDDASSSPNNIYQYLRPVLALVLLFVFLVGVQALSTGIKGLGSGFTDGLLKTVSNPFMGLVAGILTTTLVQSSSVTTSLVVGMTATGVLPLSYAIPVVMGANIGTTVTNTIAALAQIGRRIEFRRAFAAATCHDFFNYLTVMALLPLELATGFLEKSSAAINSVLPTLSSDGGSGYKSPLKVALKTVIHGIEAVIAFVTSNEIAGAVLLMIVGILLIFGSLVMITRVMKKLVLSRMEGMIRKVLGRGITGGAMSILAGASFTVLVQSSSITTSVMVPLAGAGLVRLWQVFPVTVGANIGTTVTALIASLAFSGPKAELARQIALVHLLFNVSGTLVFYVPPWTRKWPMYAAQWLAKLAVKSKRWALIYVVAVFYGVPAALVFIAR